MKRQQFIKSGEGDNYPYAQDHCFVKIASKDTGGQLCLIEDTLKPGFHLARHHHKIMTETFYMLEGTMELIFDDETILLQKGDTITVPPNVWHEAKCEFGGKMLTVFEKGEFDTFLQGFLSMSNEQFEDAEFIKAYAEKFDIYES